MHITGPEEKCFTSARFSFDGLSEWLPPAVRETWEKDSVVIRHPFEEHQIFSVGVLKGRIQVTLRLHSELKSAKSEQARISRTVPYVEVESEQPESLKWYRELGNRLENVFSLLVGSSLAIATMFVYCDKESGRVIEKRHRHRTPFQPFDCVRCSPSQMASAVSIWLSEGDGFRSVENLALGVLRKGRLFVETEFLSLSQALEGFHRATTKVESPSHDAFIRTKTLIADLLRAEDLPPDLSARILSAIEFADEPSFAARLRNLCERVENELLIKMNISRKVFIREIVDTRNLYTHAGSDTRKPPTGLADLFLLNQKMKALLRGVLLLHLGLTQEQISGLVIREATRWQ
ncbi:MAG TPA: HEPN domain-containing protein [Terracidiphilus sp.]|jgi:hypothetical protein